MACEERRTGIPLSEDSRVTRRPLPYISAALLLVLIPVSLTFHDATENPEISVSAEVKAPPPTTAAATTAPAILQGPSPSAGASVAPGVPEQSTPPAPTPEVEESPAAEPEATPSFPKHSEAPTPPPRSLPATGSPKDYARSVLSAAQYACIDKLFTHESNWDYRATNPTSGAYGIPQALPASKMATAGADWRTNPITQVRWGLSYVQQRYGTPCSAWAFWQNNQWY